MMSYELAIDEDGEPFDVPPQVAGWRVRRAADGRGRPALLHGRGNGKGKPLIVRVNASHDELLAAAGPGKYRLDAVDEYRRKVDGVRTALTGPLSADEDDPSEDDSSAEIVGSSGNSGGSAARPLEDVLCQVVNANTRMVEKALGQIGTVMSGVAELLNAAHNAGITSRMPPPPPPAPPPPVEYREDEDEDDEDDEEAAPTSGIPDFVRLLIKEAVDKVVPLIFEKLTSGSGLGGLPLEALLDWRKAAPNPAAAPSEPAASAAPSAPAAPITPAASSESAPSAPASWPAGAATASPVASSPPSPAPAPASAASGREPAPGTAPAAAPATPAASSPRTQEDAAASINAHVLQVWQGLTPPERARAGQLIARLTAEERTAWLAELARLTVPEAITRARAIIYAQPPPTPTSQLPTATPKGDPS